MQFFSQIPRLKFVELKDWLMYDSKYNTKFFTRSGSIARRLEIHCTSSKQWRVGPASARGEEVETWVALTAAAGVLDSGRM
jgi:hypothetical protein